MNLLQAASKVLALGAAIKAAEHHALDRMGTVIEEEAKRVIGTYEYGWPQLSASGTLKNKAEDTAVVRNWRNARFY